MRFLREIHFKFSFYAIPLILSYNVLKSHSLQLHSFELFGSKKRQIYRFGHEILYIVHYSCDLAVLNVFQRLKYRRIRGKMKPYVLCTSS